MTPANRPLETDLLVRFMMAGLTAFVPPQDRANLIHFDFSFNSSLSWLTR